MVATVEAESTLTDRYQTTVPETVRRVLKLGKRDRIHYIIQPDGAVLMTRAQASQEEGADPVLASFLDFLARDMARHPERIQALDVSLAERTQALVQGVEVDFDAVLPADDE